MHHDLILTEEEAFALLRLAVLSSEEDDDQMSSAVRKLGRYCKTFLVDELRQPIPA